MNEKLDPKNLPNAEVLLDEIISILEYVNTPDMMDLKKADQDAFENAVEETFKEFADRYYYLFKMLLTGGNLDPLFYMLECISKVNHGQDTIENAEMKVGHNLSQFLPENLRAMNMDEYEKITKHKN